jgi:signal transduction histidine kinase
MQTTQTLTASRATRADLATLGLASLGIAMLAVAVVFGVYRAAVPADGARGAYVTTGWTDAGVLVETGGGGLQANDVVHAVNGLTLDAWGDALFDGRVARPALEPGTTLRYQVLRSGQTQTVDARLAPYPLVEMLLANWGTVLWAVLMTLVSGYLFWRRPREASTRALLIFSTAILGSSLPWMLGVGPVDLVAGPLGIVLYLAATFLLYTIFWVATLHFALVFPAPMASGAWQSRLVALAYVVPLGIQGGWILVTRFTTESTLAWIGGWTSAQLLLVPAIILLAIGLMALQWQRSGADERLRLRWIVAAGGTAAAMALLGWFLPTSLTGSSVLPWSAIGLSGLPFPLALGLAVRQGRLFGIESVLHRSLVYGSLTAGVVVVYAASAVLLGSLLPGDGPYAVQLLATGVAALVALPLRDRLQRTVTHFLYGDRDEPYRAIARLSERLEASVEPDKVLPTVAETVAQSLRLPYAAIELTRNGTTTIAASWGTRQGVVERMPLVHQGEEIGWLVLAQRGPEEPFSPADRALLADFARQAAAAAVAVRLTSDLQRSRQQLVTAREEERRRLRRDLHDGVGPALAGALLKLEAARSGDPESLDALLSDLERDTRRTIEDVRRLAYDLRPPVLDQLGLVGGLREEARRMTGPGLVVEVRAPDRLPEVPAAVEVAAYRIGAEALANVVHHADARRATLTLALEDDALSIEIADDGRGLPAEPRAGVGLSSMRERAEELGGSLDYGPAAEGGTRVCARLPLAEWAGHA